MFVRNLLITVAAGALLTACAATPESVDVTAPKITEPVAEKPAENKTEQAPIAVAEPTPAKPTAAEAKAYVEAAEKSLADLSEFTQRTAWVQETYINYDTNWLLTKAQARYTEEGVKLAQGAAKFNDTDVDVETRRKLNLLRLSLTLPASNRAGAAEELATVTTRLSDHYSTATFQFNGKPTTLTDATALMAKSRNPKELKALWTGWMETAASAKGDYTEMVRLSNEGSRELGFADTGAMWRSNYDMTPEAFSAETERLWAQVEPLYKNLHCYVRRKLNERYGDAVQPNYGPIRADLLGNMWGQDWSNIYDIVAPKNVKSSYSLDNLLKAKRFDAKKMMKTGEYFYTSIGLDALPATFWERSMITRPKDREVVCHASAWDVDNADDLRVKMCTEVNGSDFYTVHHELGHNFYQRAYKNQPYLFKNGAHDGFHEAIGDFIGLSSVTPTYLKQVGLLNSTPSESEDIGFLMQMALQKIAFLPFSVMVDRWRWDVYDGSVSEADYNKHWWELINKYQGLTPPVTRPSNAFDPAAKYHVANSVPYTRYFLAHILQFQFHAAACKQIDWDGPLHRCSIYGHKEVGAKFNAMMEMGQSKPWPDALEVFTGSREMDGGAIMAYFAPLNAWLTKENEGQQCGW